MSKYIALVPAYKPESLMIDMLRELTKENFDIVVINDGSGEEFDPIFEEAKNYATVLVHPQNMGKGQGIRTGLAYIKDNFAEDCIIVTVDADGQHKVPDAMALCALAEAEPDTLYLGSRKLTGKVPLRSRLGNGITRLVYILTTGLRVHDTQTGLRAFSGAMIPDMLQIGGNRYEYEMNVLLEFARDKKPIKEMEIETIYINNNEGSHFNAFKDSYRIYKEILKFSASSLISFVVDYILFSVLSFTPLGTPLANVIARVISSVVNFTINKKFVFKSKGNLLRSALKYFLLAAAILVGNTLVLYLFTDVLHVFPMVAKIITEVLFFMINWVIQRRFVFKKKKKK